MGAGDGTPIELELDADSAAKLGRLAQMRNSTTATVALEAIRLYLDREERRAAFLQEGTDSLNSYRATGLHLTGDEVDTWIAQLEAGDDDAVPPPCHT